MSISIESPRCVLVLSRHLYIFSIAAEFASICVPQFFIFLIYFKKIKNLGPLNKGVGFKDMLRGK